MKNKRHTPLEQDLFDQQKREIKSLKEEVKFLKLVNKVNNNAHDFFQREKERQMAITKQITYLFIIIDSLDKLTNNDCSSMSKVIKKAMDKIKAYLGEAMLQLPLDINKVLNNSEDEEQ